MSPADATLLIAVGLVAGLVNTLAGGGSMLTVPLLVLLGLPGTVANGTNRVGVLVQGLVACWRFDAEGISELRSARPLLLPVVLGSLAGAASAAQFSDRAFEQVFAAIMLLLLIPVLRGRSAPAARRARPWSRATNRVAFFAIGFYGGALQAGVGLLMLFALNRAGFDLARANAVKIVLATALALVSVPVFVLEGQVAWMPAAMVSLGFATGATAGARFAALGGDALIRGALAVAVIALAGHMFGLY